MKYTYKTVTLSKKDLGEWLDSGWELVAITPCQMKKSSIFYEVESYLVVFRQPTNE